MRWLLKILAIYLILLSAVPCSDTKNRCESPRQETEIALSHSHNQDTDDKCAPFCFCSCCSVNIASFHFKSFEINQPLEVGMSQKVALFDYIIISNYHENIWQPPKFTI